MISAIAQNAVDTTFIDVEKMILKVAWNFWKKFGGDHEGHKSTANEAYMIAYGKFDPSRGFQFTTYLWHAVWNNLTKANRGNIIDRMTFNGEGLDVSTNRHNPKSVVDWEAVSEDACIVLGLFFDDPEWFQSQCKNKGAKAQRRGLIEHLQRSLGWTGARIAESFGEIREALQ